MRTCLAYVLVAVPLLCNPGWLTAAVLHVDVARGSDSSGDGSRDRPWCTITHAVAQVVDSHAEIHVAAGSYEVGAGSGCQEAFPLDIPAGVSLIGAGAGVTVIDAHHGSRVMRFEQAGPSPVVRGFTIRNGLVAGGVSRMEQRGGCIRIKDASPVIRNNTIEGCEAPYGGAGILVEGVSRTIIEGNLFRDNMSGVRGGIIELDAGGDVVITGNLFVDNVTGAMNAEGAILYADTIDSLTATIHNNIMAGTDGNGIAVFNRWVTVTIANNTIAGATLDAILLGYAGSATICNNILSGSGRYAIEEIDWADFGAGDPRNASHNLFYDNRMGLYLDKGSNRYLDLERLELERPEWSQNLQANPGFVASRAGDYHIRTDSPCVGAGGTRHAPPTDIDGDSRGFPVDIGADEAVPEGAQGVVSRAVPGRQRALRPPARRVSEGAVGRGKALPRGRTPPGAVPGTPAQSFEQGPSEPAVRATAPPLRRGVAQPPGEVARATPGPRGERQERTTQRSGAPGTASEVVSASRPGEGATSAPGGQAAVGPRVLVTIDRASIYSGETVVVQATTTGARDTGYTWRTSDERTATVTQLAGSPARVRGRGDGTATILATGINSRATGSVVVEVTRPELTVHLEKNALYVGETTVAHAVTAGNVDRAYRWMSADRQVARVDGGEESTVAVTALGPGVARIVAVGLDSGATGVATVVATRTEADIVLLAPPDGGVIGVVSPVPFRWFSRDAAGFVLTLCPSADFAERSDCSEFATGNRYYSMGREEWRSVVSMFDVGDTVYWRVASERADGEVSPIWHFNLDVHSPPYDILAIVVSDTEIELRWTNAERYERILVYRKYNDSRIYRGAVGGTGSSFRDTELRSDTAFRYQLVASVEEDWVLSREVSARTLPRKYGAPVLLAPRDGERLSAFRAVTLSWEGNGEDSVHYWVGIYEPSTSVLLWEQTDETTLAIAPDRLSPGVSYHWRVWANDARYSEWMESKTWRFLTEAAAAPAAIGAGD